MQLLISSEGDNDPPGMHYMVLDGTGFLVDLSAVEGELLDPTVKRVEWTLLSRTGETREGGTITLQDGTQRTFFDQGLLKPYLDAWHARQDALAA